MKADDKSRELLRKEFEREEQYMYSAMIDYYGADDTTAASPAYQEWLEKKAIELKSLRASESQKERK